ncbi:hypothetical protein [uncultured Pseudoteredinibacter sp.]|uniref:hypothetical protein n=1 Tax=uncultured Pseudoteredinibacter sp. TaxID=1641701 RepID=UPI002627CE8C|nr:hypothetical protein [uncultured Pseudoteredinibacter sp.]
MLRKLAFVVIIIIVSYTTYHYFVGATQSAAHKGVTHVSNGRLTKTNSPQQNSMPSESVDVVKLFNASSNNFSSRSSITLKDSEHSINNQLKLLAQAYKPNAEVIANVERFENFQFELIEEIGEIITMKEGDAPQEGDPDENPTYAENKAHKSDDVYELALFTQFIGECFRSGFKDKPACTGTYGTDINRLSIRTPRAIDKLDQLALQGDLQAQSLYHASLLSAVDSFDMNTARDTELWLQRRLRMIGYSLKFARAGSALATKQLAKLFDSSDYIEAQPFWAAVFYSQLSTLDNSGSFDIQRLISKNGLDEGEIEQARYDLFEGDNQ